MGHWKNPVNLVRMRGLAKHNWSNANRADWQACTAQGGRPTNANCTGWTELKALTSKRAGPHLRGGRWRLGWPRSVSASGSRALQKEHLSRHRRRIEGVRQGRRTQRSSASGRGQRAMARKRAMAGRQRSGRGRGPRWPRRRSRGDGTGRGRAARGGRGRAGVGELQRTVPPRGPLGPFFLFCFLSRRPWRPCADLPKLRRSGRGRGAVGAGVGCRPRSRGGLSAVRLRLAPGGPLGPPFWPGCCLSRRRRGQWPLAEMSAKRAWAGSRGDCKDGLAETVPGRGRGGEGGWVGRVVRGGPACGVPCSAW